MLARRPEDGALIWAYQFTPHDNWDYDANAALVLADVTVAGHTRKALVTFDKNGFQYTLDRATGELLAAHPYVTVNWAKGVDLKSGRPILDPALQTGVSKGPVKNICPSLEAGARQPRLHHRPIRRGRNSSIPRQTTSAWIGSPGRRAI